MGMHRLAREREAGIHREGKYFALISLEIVRNLISASFSP
jgi:hypothetical protein